MKKAFFLLLLSSTMTLQASVPSCVEEFTFRHNMWVAALEGVSTLPQSAIGIIIFGATFFLEYVETADWETTLKEVASWDKPSLDEIRSMGDHINSAHTAFGIPAFAGDFNTVAHSSPEGASPPRLIDREKIERVWNAIMQVPLALAAVVKAFIEYRGLPRFVPNVTDSESAVLLNFIKTLGPEDYGRLQPLKAAFQKLRDWMRTPYFKGVALSYQRGFAESPHMPYRSRIHPVWILISDFSETSGDRVLQAVVRDALSPDLR